MEFDKNKILTVVTADQARKGQKGWFSNHTNLLKSYVEQNNPDTLKEINRDSIKPFCDGYSHYALFYPAPEPTYAERQAEWVKENNVKEGTKVRFTKNFNEKGLTGTISRIRDTYLIVSHDSIVGVNWCVSFTSLEVIKEPSYRPFNNNELNDLVGKMVTNKYTGNNKLVTERLGPSAVRVGDNGCTAKDLFHYFTLNGEPCGIKELDK